GASWGDYDNDRDLDLYICGYVQYKEPQGKPPGSTRQYGRDVPYTLNPSSYEPQANLLFRNNGDGTFTETAVKLGVANPKGRSLNALWQDFNDDGRLDLYIANDISDNVLYLNQNGSFKDISHAAWVADYRGAMGLADGDWNGDGDNDLFVTHWVAQENALYDSLLNDKVPDKTPGKTPVKSQTGEQSVPPVRFMDLADMAGLGQVALHKIGWGAEFLDFDADGWLDLLVTNGSTFETADTPPRLRPQKPFLFWNKNGKSFHNIAPLDAALDEEHVGRGLAVSDYNGDGYLDFLMVNHQEGIRLFRGEAVPETNWAIFILRSRSGSGGALNGRGEGAQLIATVNGRRLRRSGGGVSYLSQSSRRVHFGLGDAKTIDSLEVRWLGGGTDTYTNLAANNYWELEEGNPVPERRKVGRSENGKATRQEKTSEMDERQRITLFWERQRAAVQALKVEKNIDKAISLFKEALDLDPVHEDSLNYLGQAQVMKGELRGAIAAYERLTRVNSSSHRGFRQLGFLLARTARRAEELSTAEVALERAFEINSEETGVLILLGEVDLMQGELEKARERLEQVCSSNPRSVTGLFLLGYIAWKKGESLQSRTFLTRAMEARAVDEKKPEGSTSEGDVQFKMHSNESLLSGFFNTKHNTFPLIYTNLDKELN
ncbi:MAG: tetratricopeptide repeat protein, partial [bacterium]|nr:tetratricopeptide repeat protein [bacterium]